MSVDRRIGFSKWKSLKSSQCHAFPAVVHLASTSNCVVQLIDVAMLLHLDQQLIEEETFPARRMRFLKEL